mgnify:CR=1 FL=1
MTPDEKLRRLEELYKEKLITDDEYKAMRMEIQGQTTF